MSYKIITPVATEPVSLAEARLQVRLLDSDGTAEDALLTAYITAARELAEHYTGRALAEQTLEAALDDFPSCDGEIELPRPPVASITSIKYDDTDGVEQTVGSSTYALSSYGDSRTVYLVDDSEWPDADDEKNSVRVRYVAGFGATGAPALPRAVKNALLLMVAWMYEHRGDEMGAGDAAADDIKPPAAKVLLNTVKLWSR